MSHPLEVASTRHCRSDMNLAKVDLIGLDDQGGYTFAVVTPDEARSRRNAHSVIADIHVRCHSSHCVTEDAIPFQPLTAFVHNIKGIVSAYMHT